MAGVGFLPRSSFGKRVHANTYIPESMVRSSESGRAPYKCLLMYSRSVLGAEGDHGLAVKAVKGSSGHNGI